MIKLQNDFFCQNMYYNKCDFSRRNISQIKKFCFLRNLCKIRFLPLTSVSKMKVSAGQMRFLTCSADSWPSRSRSTQLTIVSAVFQIRRGNRDDLGIISRISP